MSTRNLLRLFLITIRKSNSIRSAQVATRAAVVRDTA